MFHEISSCTYLKIENEIHRVFYDQEVELIYCIV
jgi:hypothetical protein